MKIRYNKDKFITAFNAAAQLAVTRQVSAFSKWIAENFNVKPAGAYVRGVHVHPLYLRKDIDWVEGELKKLREAAEAEAEAANKAEPAAETAPAIATVPNLPATTIDFATQVTQRLEILAQAVDSLITVQNQVNTLLQAMLDEMTRPKSAVTPQALTNGIDRPQH